MSKHVDDLIELHFEGRIRPEQERLMREHVATCETCRATYEARMVVSSMDTEELDAEERLAIGLGLRPVRSATGLTRLSMFAAAAAVLLLMTGAMLWLFASSDEGFCQRGADTGQGNPALQVFVIGPGDQSKPFDGSIGTDQELAFTYTNPSTMRYLMVFALDTEGRIFWYHPAWTNPDSDPEAVPIMVSSVPVELPEAVSHRLSPGSLRLVAVFSMTPMSVQGVEAALSRQTIDEAFSGQGQQAIILDLQVER
jgi:hypothetical protein